MIARHGQRVALSGTTLVAVASLRGQVLEGQVASFDEPAEGVTGRVQTRVVRTETGTLDYRKDLPGYQVVDLAYTYFGGLRLGYQLALRLLQDEHHGSTCVTGSWSCAASAPGAAPTVCGASLWPPSSPATPVADWPFSATAPGAREDRRL